VRARASVGDRRGRDRGRLDDHAFRELTFTSTARLFTVTRPDFFVGTAAEDAVSETV